MILPIYTDEHEVLHTPTQQISNITPEIRQLAVDMRETMHNAVGIGLAAPQVGKSIALCVLEHDDPEVDPEDRFPFIALINPRVTWRSTQQRDMEEACLSIPGLAGIVRRPSRVRVKALNLKGETLEIEAKGLYARALQHEIDHLNGIVFTDYLSKKKLHKRETPDYPRV